MRDFGHANITHREAEAQSRRALRMLRGAGLGLGPSRVPPAAHRWPWYWCDDYAAAH